MKLIKSNLEQKGFTKLNRNVKDDISSGFMTFGENNDYPETIETLILASPTGKAVADTFSKFIAGDEFIADIGKEIVGKDFKGKDVTLDRLRREISQQLSYFNGVYLHLNMNTSMLITSVQILPFKKCRLSKIDSNGFSARVAYCNDWTTKQKKDINWFSIYTGNKDSFSKQIEKKSFNGQVFVSFFDESFVYPLSPFDSVYLDLDTEYQIQLFKNRELRNGFSKKIVVNMELSDDESEQLETEKELQKFMGADGKKALLIQSEFDESGQLIDRSFKIEQIDTNIDKDLFQNSFAKETSNNIRKAVKALPAVLIDYEEGKLSSTSGESITQAVNYYNAVTRGYRQQVSEILKEIFSNSTNEKLKNNLDWRIKEVSL